MRPVVTGELIWYAAIIEVIGGPLLIVGLFSRLVAFGGRIREFGCAHRRAHRPQAVGLTWEEAMLLDAIIGMVPLVAGERRSA